MNGLYDEILIALHSVWTRRWLALGVAWGIALAGWLAVSLIPNKYTAQAKVLIQPRAMLSNAVGVTAADRQQNLDSVRQSLTSSDSLQTIVKSTDLAQDVATPRDMSDAVSSLAQSIKIVSEQDNIVTLSMTSGNSGLSDAAKARLANQVVQKLIEQFVARNGADDRSEVADTVKFLDAQIEQRGQQLAAAEAKRSAFEQKYMAMLPGVGTIADRIAAARSEMARIDGELAAAQSGVAAVRGQMASTPANTRTAGAIIAQAPSAGSAIEAQMADGRARGWTDNHPDMVALRDQLARVGGGSTGGSRMGPATVSSNPMFVSLRSMLAEKQAVAGALSARKGQIQGQINAVIAQQAADPKVAAEQTEVDRAYQVLKAQYDKLLSDREDIKLRGDVQASADAVKFTVIAPPSTPKTPNAPNRPLLLTMVLLAALCGGAAAAFGLGQVKASFPTATRLAKVSGLPVLGSIREVVTPGERPQIRQKLKLFAGGVAALLGLYAVMMGVELVQRSMVA